MVLTPIWSREMGQRLCVAREKRLCTQGELAGLLSTPGRPVHQSQVRLAEKGLLRHLNVNWARLEAVFPKDLPFILIGAYDATYNRRLIAQRYWEHRQKVLRKRLGFDPKKQSK